ncbi:polyphosphate polymerase domain-containing protein [Candidatus Saccharibacteria bacterium]|nr:polyphosphate polymerase domain-containing protein [Candidatus Saccharibacteria bacterium]
MEIFKRSEKKYLISKEQQRNLLKKCGENLVHNKYYKATVGSVYFDTKNDDLIINSIEKPNFKEKVRIRAYGVPEMEDYIFFEMKMKRKVGREKDGYKRRFELLLKDYYDYAEGRAGLEEIARRKVEARTDVQVAREIDYIYKYLQLEPRAYISCERESYQGAEDENLRLTFDTNLRYRFEDLRLEKNDDCEEFFDGPPGAEDSKEKNIILEVKTTKGLPLWLVKAMSEEKIYPRPFSKYGKIYQKVKSKGVKNV